VVLFDLADHSSRPWRKVMAAPGGAEGKPLYLSTND
jgi:hypothetical protein